MGFASACIELSIERYLSDLGGLPLSRQTHSCGHRPFCEAANYPMTTWDNDNATRADTMNGKYKYFGQTRFHATTPPFARHPIDERSKGSSRSLSSSSRIRVNDSWESIYFRICCFFYGLCDIITELQNLFTNNSFHIRSFHTVPLETNLIVWNTCITC